MMMHWQRRWLAKAIFGSALVGLMAATLAAMIGACDFGDFTADRRVIFTGMFGTFAALLLAVFATYVMELVRPCWVVRLDETGLQDRRLSRGPIAWRDIGAVIPVQHGMQMMLALGIADPRSVPMPGNPLWRVNRMAGRIVGYAELSVRITGLDADLFAVMQAIETFSAAGGVGRPLEEWDIVRASKDCEDEEYRGRIGYVVSTCGADAMDADRTICVMFDGDEYMAVLKEGDLTPLGRKDHDARTAHEDWIRSGRSLGIGVDPATGYGHLQD